MTFRARGTHGRWHLNGIPFAAILFLLAAGLCGFDSEPTLSTVQQASDQAMLAKIAIEAKYRDVRRAAAGKLTDQSLLAKIATEDKDKDVRQAAVEKLTDQAVLAKMAVEAKYSSVRLAAAGKLTDQLLLAKIATEDEDADVRQAAVEKLTDRGLLVMIGPWLKPELARQVSDKALLAKIAVEAKDGAVRRAAVEKLTDQAVLAKIAVEDRDENVRPGAFEKLTDQAMLAKIAVEDRDENVRRAAVGKLTDQSLLAKIAVEGPFDVLRVAAAQRLADPIELEQVAKHSTAREVLKIVLASLGDKGLLDRIAASAEAPAMRLAAAQKAGAKSWRQIFDAATGRGGNAQMIGDALGAAALFPEVQPDAKEGVQKAAMNLIRLGDERRIPEMVDLLEGYGDKALAEDYLNSGQPDLGAAGVAWASRRGYPIDRGAGSHRATWGR